MSQCIPKQPIIAFSPWLLMLASALASAGCGRSGKPAPEGGDSRRPSEISLKRNVDLAQVQQRPLVYSVDTVGVLEAEAQTDIAAGVAGVVDTVHFREGDNVSPSSVLIKIDQRRYDSGLKVAEANEQRAVANLALAKDLARRAMQAGAGASAEERAKTTLALSIAQAEEQASLAALELARSNFDRSQVRAPYFGRINQRKVTPGCYVEEKTVIATMADLSRIRLVGWVPETAAPIVRDLMAHQEARLKIARIAVPIGGWLTSPVLGLADSILAEMDQVPSGFDPEFNLQAFPHLTLRARIFYMSTVANMDTHMFECKAEINLKGIDQELRPGYTARIRLPLRSSPSACVIPEEAGKWSSARPSERGFIAFVPFKRIGPDGKPEWIAKARALELGYRAPGWVEVRQGLVPGEWVVRRGAEALEEGTPIRFPEAQLQQMDPAR